MNDINKELKTLLDAKNVLEKYNVNTKILDKRIEKIVLIVEQIRKIELIVNDFLEKEQLLHEDLEKIDFTDDKELEEIKLDIFYYTNKINRVIEDFILAKEFAENEINKILEEI